LQQKLVQPDLPEVVKGDQKAERLFIAILDLIHSYLDYPEVNGLDLDDPHGQRSTK
jgi:hypothetical protein